MVTSCLVGPCLSGALHEPGVSPYPHKGSNWCQGWGCQLPDPVAPHLMYPCQQQMVPAPTWRLGACCAHPATLLNKAGLKSTFLVPAQLQKKYCFILLLRLYLSSLWYNLIGCSMLLVCCQRWERQMAYLEQVTFNPYLKWRVFSKCSDVSRKLLVHSLKAAQLTLSGS